MQNILRWITLALAIALGACAWTAPADAAPLRNAKAKAGDCVACHKGEKRLPAGHVATAGMKLDACEQCHKPAEPTTLRMKLPASHLHQLAGVGCVQCHGNVKKQALVEMDKCVACHETDALAQKTASVKPNNPHDSKHWGKNTDCNLCHHQHAKSENYCAQCHKFDFKTP